MKSIEEQCKKQYTIENIPLRLIVAIFSISITYLIANNSFITNGFEELYLIPLVFGMYFLCSQFANLFNKSLTMSFFTVVLLFRYLITPLVMCLSNYYSAMFNGAGTSFSQKDVSIKLMLYEMIVMFVTIELCIRFILNREIVSKKKQQGIASHSNAVYLVSIALGVLGAFLFPNLLLNKFNFLFIHGEITIVNRKTYIVLLSYLLQFAQVFIFLMIVKHALSRKMNQLNYNRVMIFLAGFINIAFIWTTNRMTIFIVAGTTLAVLIYAFPEQKKKLFALVFILVVFMAILLSSYRLFGTTGNQVDEVGFKSFFKLNNLSKQLQIYFAGPDSVAGGVAVDDYYKSLITPKTFLNDTFLGVNFIKQLPVFLNDFANTSGDYFNRFCSNGSRFGLIIPLIGQGYVYLGFLFSPFFTVFFTVALFLIENKVKNLTNIDYLYVFQLLGFYFALFPIYNYTIMIQNLFNQFLPLYIIIWLNHHLCIKKNQIH